MKETRREEAAFISLIDFIIRMQLVFGGRTCHVLFYCVLMRD